MKFSQFNSLIKYDKNFLLYNAYTSKYLLLHPILKDLLDAAKTEGIEELNSIHPLFYHELLQGEFIVPLGTDEIAKVKEVSKMVDMDDSIYRLTINPTMNCNFKCWYCYETHVKGSRMSRDMIDRTSAFITQTAEQPSIKNFTLSWFGGEPLLYFEDIVLPIMQHFNRECEKNGISGGVTFTTNAYLITKDMASQLREHGTKHMQITLDGAEEDHDLVRFVSKSKGSYRQIIKNIKLLIDCGIFVTLRINYTLAKLERCMGILKDIEDLDTIQRSLLKIDFHRVWQDSGEDVVDMTKEVLGQFQESGFKVNSNLDFNNVLDSCYADKMNSCTINYNGDLFKCTARDFTTAKREGYISELGKIVWENDSLSKRLAAKFNNVPCLSCRIMPLCNGGCSQHAIENLGRDYCVHGYDERQKDKVVLSRFEQAISLAK
jgi:uncharacterized protein